MKLELEIPESSTAQKAHEQMNGMSVFMSYMCEDDGIAVVILRNNKDTVVPLTCVFKQFDVIYKRLMEERFAKIQDTFNDSSSQRM